MPLIVWLQALEPHALWHLGFAMLSWCGDGPLYVLLFPLLYWRKAPEEPPAPMQEPPALMEEVQEPDALVATNGHEQGEPVVAGARGGVPVPRPRRMRRCYAPWRRWRPWYVRSARRKSRLRKAGQ